MSKSKITSIKKKYETEVLVAQMILEIFYLNRAFGWKPPEYGHLPLILNPDGTKLSKRHDHASVDYYR